MSMLSIGSGYRTYVIVTVLIVLVLAERVLGIDIPGVQADANWIEAILTYAGMGTIRAGIAAK